MLLPVRHTSKYCNFLVKPIGGDLCVTCMDGSTAVLKSFCPSLYETEYYKMLAAAPQDRKAICYNFTLKTDRDGRKYFSVSVTLTLENPYAYFGFSDGCISMDMNWDHLALTEIAADGQCLKQSIVPFNIKGKASGQARNIIGAAMKKVG